ncbi:MAG: hypothetical protein ABIG89_04975 [Candidatus Woesearchaeota archaeon]
MITRKKKVMKYACVFKIRHGNRTYDVDGRLLVKRSEERVKA